MKKPAMKISAKGLAFIKGWERFVPHPYDDALAPLKATGQYREWRGGKVLGTLTIGYGHTDAAGPPKITRGMRLTEAQASELLDVDLDKVEAAVNRLVTVVLSQHKFDALVSFHYNTGGLGRSLLLKRLNKLDFAGAAEQFQWWRKSTVDGVSKVNPGLVRRRAAEKLFFLEGKITKA